MLPRMLLRGGSWCLGGGEPQLRALERGEGQENTELGLHLLSTWGIVCTGYS